MSSPRKRVKIVEIREGQGRKRNKNESEETEEIKTFPSTITCYKDSRHCPTLLLVYICSASYCLDLKNTGWYLLLLFFR